MCPSGWRLWLSGRVQLDPEMPEARKTLKCTYHRSRRMPWTWPSSTLMHAC